MREHYEELKMEVIAFDRDIWTDSAVGADPANPASTGSGRQNNQNMLVTPSATDGTSLAP